MRTEITQLREREGQRGSLPSILDPSNPKQPNLPHSRDGVALTLALRIPPLGPPPCRLAGRVRVCERVECVCLCVVCASRLTPTYTALLSETRKIS